MTCYDLVMMSLVLYILRGQTPCAKIMVGESPVLLCQTKKSWVLGVACSQATSMAGLSFVSAQADACITAHELNCLRVSRSTERRAVSLVEASTTFGAFPASLACFHRPAHKHHLSPAFSPLKPGRGVDRSLPCALVYSRKSSVTSAATEWLPMSSSPTLCNTGIGQ